MGGGPAPRITGAVEAALLNLLKGDNNHLTLAQCGDRLAEQTGVLSGIARHSTHTRSG